MFYKNLFSSQITDRQLCLIFPFCLLYSFTYERVQENADKVWHWQNYNLVREYEKRSVLPPPFSIISHCKVICLYFLHRWRKVKKTAAESLRAEKKLRRLLAMSGNS